MSEIKNGDSCIIRVGVGPLKPHVGKRAQVNQVWSYGETFSCSLRLPSGETVLCIPPMGDRIEKVVDVNAVEIPLKLKVKDGTAIPVYQTRGSAGFDVEAAESVAIPPGSWCLVSTGLYPEIPDQFELQVRSRSGMAAKNGIFVLNSPGTIDSDYRGEIKIILANFSEETYQVLKGDRVAQLVLARVYTAVIERVTDLTETIRGTGGCGHTGR